MNTDILEYELTDAVSEVLVNHLPPPVGGVIQRGVVDIMNVEATDENVEEMLQTLLLGNMTMFLDEQKTTQVTFVAGRTIDGDFATRSDVMVVSKDPTQNEATTGRRQTDDAAEQWKCYVKSKGLNIGDWFCTSICPFSMPKDLAGKGTLKAAHANEGMALLTRAINVVKPKYVLLFGADALKFFITAFDKKLAKQLNFTTCRGTIVELPGGVKVVACIHPARIVAAPELLQDFYNDLDLFVELVSTGSRVAPPTCEYTVVKTHAEANNVILDLINHDYKKFSIDLEWGADSAIRTIQLSHSRDHAYVFYLYDEKQNYTEIGEKGWIFKALAYLLKRDGIGIIGHNVRGDIKILRQNGLDLLDQFLDNGFDTMLAFHIIPGNETLEKKLELVAVRLLGTDRYDLELRQWIKANGLSQDFIDQHGYGTIPEEVLVPYAAMDAAVTFGCYEILEKQLVETGVDKLYYNYLHPVNAPVLEMEETGILCDEQRLAVLSDIFQAKCTSMVGELQRAINWEPYTAMVTKLVKGKEVSKEIEMPGFNPGSTLQINEILYGYMKAKKGVKTRVSPSHAVILNLTPIKATDDTAWASVVQKNKTHLMSPSTDSESLGILSSQHPFPKLLQRYRFCAQVAKNFLQTYSQGADGRLKWTGGVGSTIGKDGRARTTYRLTLETGRYSTSPNFQNFPKKQEKELISLFTDSKGLDPRYHSIRSVFMTDPKWVIIDSDWKSAELFAMGAIAGDDVFNHILATTDLHTATMQKMFGTLECQNRLISSYTIDELNKLRKEDKVLDSYRTASKSIVFGVPYGRGPSAIQRELAKEGLNFEVDEIKVWINTFYESYQLTSMYLNSCKEAVAWSGCKDMVLQNADPRFVQPGRIINPYGRVRAFPYTKDNGVMAGMQREAVNFNIQSTVGDTMSQALINFSAYQKMRPGRFKIIASIHDAVMLAVPVEHIEEVVDRAIPLCMTHGCEVPQVGLRFQVDKPDITLRWGEHATKEDLLEVGVPERFI